MSEDEDLSPRERQTLDSIDSKFASSFDASHGTLEDWAFYWWDSTAVVTLGDNPLEAAILLIERNACLALSLFIDEISEASDPDEVRAWARSQEALSGVLEVFLPTDSAESLNLEILMYAIAALAFTERCRREIVAGRAETATWAMHQAAWLNHLIYSEIRDRADEPAIKIVSALQVGAERGRKAIHKLRRRERDDRRGEYRLLRAQKVKKEQILRELARKWKVSVKHTRKWLNANTDFEADS